MLESCPVPFKALYWLPLNQSYSKLDGLQKLPEDVISALKRLGKLLWWWCPLYLSSAITRCYSCSRLQRCRVASGPGPALDLPVLPPEAADSIPLSSEDSDRHPSTRHCGGYVHKGPRQWLEAMCWVPRALESHLCARGSTGPQQCMQKLLERLGQGQVYGGCGSSFFCEDNCHVSVWWQVAVAVQGRVKGRRTWASPQQPPFLALT